MGCLADLRLRASTDPTDARSWDKSNGCLFGANERLMMEGVHAATNAQGIGHHTFALEDGDIDASPASSGRSEFLYHGVPRDMPMRWSNRYWYTGGFEWRDNVAYCRAARDCSNGWSLKFYE